MAMRSRVLLLAVVSMAALSPTAAGASGSSQRARASAAPVVLPPDLVTLEQRMSELQVSSERFTLSEWFSGVSLPKELSALIPKGEVARGLFTLSPPAGEVTLTLFGERLTMKLVDGVVYLDVPTLWGHDGGRPWVKLERRDFHKMFGGTLGIEGAGQPGSVAVDPYAPLRARLNAALSITELGPSTVDGQPVTGFAAKLRPLVTKVTLKASRRSLTITSRRSLEVFIAANGLPVRTRTTTTIGHVHEIAAADITGVNEVTLIEAPAASQTITTSELRALVAKEKAEARARRKHHRKRA
jgi:hypothetical protein